MITNTAPGVQARVLVVDDDAGLRNEIGDYLTDHGLEVELAESGQEMDKLLRSQVFDIVVLDVMLPGEDGLAICRRLSERADVGVIMLSAMGGDVDRILGLELGADDYLAKPCNPRELLARIKALHRRREQKGGHKTGGITHAFAGFELDAGKRLLRAPGGVASLLTAGELAVLLAFIDNPRRVLTREQLLEMSRGEEPAVFDRAIDVQISRLRRKLGVSGSDELIRTQRGQGYMFEAHVQRL
jgi:two-component system OmpR family response regulator